MWSEGTRVLVAQGTSALTGVVRFLGGIPVIEYEIGPMAGYVLMDSLNSSVTIKVLDGCGHIFGEDEGIIHCRVCTCSWCLNLNRALPDR